MILPYCGMITVYLNMVCGVQTRDWMHVWGCFLEDKFASNTKGLDKKPKKGIQESNSHVSINVDDDSCSGSDI